MKQVLKQDRTEKIVCLGDEITYGHRPEWSDATWRPLKMSLMRVRQYFDYDPHEEMPVIIWIGGGAFTHSDKNVWAPEMTYFAKRGFIVASIDYSSEGRARFPMMLEDIKLGIRYLRAHAKDFHIDPDRMVIMGESAGAYLASLVALTGEERKYDVGEYQEYSSAVSAAISLYGCTKRVVMEGGRIDLPELMPMVTEKTPPFLMFHGTGDKVVSCTESEALYDELQKHGVPSDLYLIEDANHADCPMYQPAIKDMIIEFIHKVIG
ncbi:MAG: alpha/beta hydrolase [Lachnospiraceae bacterium]|nr:alpha/beta hydrolase [Lachnospiraceae bacterium]